MEKDDDEDDENWFRGTAEKSEPEVEEDSEDGDSNDDENEDSVHIETPEEIEQDAGKPVEKQSDQTQSSDRAAKQSATGGSDNPRKAEPESVEDDVAGAEKREEINEEKEEKHIRDPKDVDMDDLLASLNRQAQKTQKERATKTQDEDAFARTDFAKTRFSPKDLRMAAYSRDYDLVQSYLGQRPEYINRQDKMGWAPAMFAARNLDVAILELFLKHDNFDLETRNKKGETALDIARNTLGGEDHPIIALLSGESIQNEDSEADRRRELEESEARRQAEEHARADMEREEQDRLEREQRERIAREEQERLEREEAWRRAEEEARLAAEAEAARLKVEEEGRLEVERLAREEEEQARKLEVMRQRAIEAEEEDRLRAGGQADPEEYFEYVQEGRSRLDTVLNEQGGAKVNAEAQPHAVESTDEEDDLDMTDYVELGRSRLDALLGPEDDHDEL
jgi:hypothetical protein